MNFIKLCLKVTGVKYWYLILIFSFPVALVLNRIIGLCLNLKPLKNAYQFIIFILVRGQRLLINLCLMLKVWLFKIYTYQYKLYLLQILLKAIVNQFFYFQKPLVTRLSHYFNIQLLLYFLFPMDNDYVFFSLRDVSKP